MLSVGLTVSSVNVNGIRAAAQKGLARWRAFDNNTGWRIDHHIATPALAAGGGSAAVERAASHGERWSDHAPVMVTYGPA